MRGQGAVRLGGIAATQGTIHLALEKRYSRLSVVMRHWFRDILSKKRGLLIERNAFLQTRSASEDPLFRESR